jgi:hypothetical protein
MYAIIVGKVEAKASVTIAPLADHVKISICPGVSATMYCSGGSRCFSQRPTTCRWGTGQEWGFGGGLELQRRVLSAGRQR